MSKFKDLAIKQHNEKKPIEKVTEIDNFIYKSILKLNE